MKKSLEQLPNSLIDVCYVDYDLHKDYSCLLKNTRKSSDKISIVKNRLISKGRLDFKVEDFKMQQAIYLKMHLDRFRNKIVLDQLALCTSDDIDLMTNLWVVSDDETKEFLFPLIKERCFLLLEDPESNSRFYFDSLKPKVKNKFIKLEIVNDVNELDELGGFGGLSETGKKIEMTSEYQLLKNAPELE